MKINKEITIVLDNFEGPLELLFHLVYKSEIDIYEVALKDITDKFLGFISEQQPPIDKCAEFISTASALIWFKSRQLLPKHDGAPPPELLVEDPHFEIIHHLIDYCRFKQAAKELVAREHEQTVYHPRGMERAGETKKNLGIDHLTLEDLAGLFQQIAAKAKQQRGQLHEEMWKVSDKISLLRQLLALDPEIPFLAIFSAELTRLELIVLFLALLELMKLGEILVLRNRGGQIIVKNSKYIHK